MSYLFITDWGNCENCIHHKHINASRDEPSEDWCECWNDYFYDEREYDLDGNELGCNQFDEKGWYEED